MVDKENQKQQNDPMVEDKIDNQEINNERKKQETSETESNASTNQTDEQDFPASEDKAASEDVEKEAAQSASDNSEDNEDNLEAALAESKDKYLRLYAEFENFRRRTAKERLDLIKTASDDILAALLPVVDDLERSLEIFKENEAVAPMYEGIQLVYQKLMNVLEQKGLTRMDVSQGSEFDSEYHEAVVQTPAPSEELKGKVVDVIENGYFLGEKVLRYAKVVIGS